MGQGSSLPDWHLESSADQAAGAVIYHFLPIIGRASLRSVCREIKHCEIEPGNHVMMRLVRIQPLSHVSRNEARVIGSNPYLKRAVRRESRDASVVKVSLDDRPKVVKLPLAGSVWPNAVCVL